MDKEDNKGVGKTKEKISEFFLHLAAYGGFNIEDGVISMWGDPSLFIPLESYTVLFKELEKLLGKTNDDLFYWLGRLYGKNSTIMLMKKYGISKKDVKEFVNGATQDGFGYMKIKYVDLESKPVSGEVVGSNAIFASNYKKKYGKSKNSVDHYMRGILAGGAEPLYDLSLDVIEKECMAKGSKECLYHFTEKKDIKFDFFRKTPIKEEDLLKKTRLMALKRKTKFKFLKRKDIKFGNGAFILEGVTGVNIPVYGLVILNELLESLIAPQKKKGIYELMATEYITSIKGKIKGVDLKKGLQELEKFGFGKFEIKLIGKNKIIIENNNNPFSIDYRTIFGKKGEAKETLIIMILQKLLAQGNVKTEITQKMSITKGQSKNIYVINIKK